MQGPAGLSQSWKQSCFLRVREADLLRVVMSRCRQHGQRPIQGRLYILGAERLFLGKNNSSALSPSSQAIYEMSRGEQDLIEDLKLARKVSGIFSCSQ